MFDAVYSLGQLIVIAVSFTLLTSILLGTAVAMFYQDEVELWKKRARAQRESYRGVIVEYEVLLRQYKLTTARVRELEQERIQPEAASQD